MGIVITLACVFKIWMMIDAMQRGGSCCGNYWIFIILMPFGDVAYFLMVKIHDPEFARLHNLIPKKKISLEEFRSKVCHCPSLKNKKLLAAALYDEKQFEECVKTVEEVCKQDQSDVSAIYTKALALKELERLEEAKFLLEALIANNLSILDYGPALALSEIYLKNTEQEKASELVRTVARKSGKLEHDIKIAEVLLQVSRKDDAKRHLDKVFDEYKNSPRYIQRRDKASFKKAKALYTSLNS